MNAYVLAAVNRGITDPLSRLLTYILPSNFSIEGDESRNDMLTIAKSAKYLYVLTYPSVKLVSY